MKILAPIDIKADGKNCGKGRALCPRWIPGNYCDLFEEWLKHSGVKPLRAQACINATVEQ